MDLNKLVSGLFSGIAASAGTAAAKAAMQNPTVQSALDDFNLKLQKAEQVATVAGVVAAVVVVFYFLPRFESPVPRIFRKRRN
jgi:hypothetical protein